MTFTRALSLMVALAASSVFAAGFDVDYDSLKVAAPPKKGSAAYRRDFKILHDYETSRTTAECKEAGSQSFASPKALFKAVLTASELEKVEKLGQELLDTAEKACAPFKEEYLRPRPYDADTSLKPCVRLPGGSKSYPSSHATMGIIMAATYAKIFPAKKAALLAYGKRIGEFRMLGGVHHPSDVDTGRDIGHQLLKMLNKNADYRRELTRLAP